jgi:predicted secreted Zn-dependent protease
MMDCPLKTVRAQEARSACAACFEPCAFSKKGRKHKNRKWLALMGSVIAVASLFYYVHAGSPMLLSMQDSGRVEAGLPAPINYIEGLPPYTSFNFYRIEGRTVNELWRSIFDPKTGKGYWHEGRHTRYAGFSSPYFDWRAGYRQLPDGWGWTDIKVGVKTSILFPRWKEPRDAERTAVHRWRSFANALKAHEFGHAIIYSSMTSEFEKEMSTLHAATRSELFALTTTAFDRFLEDVRERNDQYDHQTRYGLTQGAVFVRSGHN